MILNELNDDCLVIALDQVCKSMHTMLEKYHLCLYPREQFMVGHPSPALDEPCASSGTVLMRWQRRLTVQMKKTDQRTNTTHSEVISSEI